MVKTFLLVVLLVFFSFITGFLTDYQFSPLARFKSTKSSVLTLGGPLVSVLQTVNGKVAAVDGKSLTVSAGGKNLTVRMGDKVSIINLVATLPASGSNLTQKTPLGAMPSPSVNKTGLSGENLPNQPPSGVSNPESSLSSDFNQIKVGSQVSVMVELQKTGEFLAKTVFVIPQVDGR